MRRAIIALAAISGMLLVAGCAADEPAPAVDDGPTSSASNPPAPDWLSQEELTGELVVFGAASLGEVFSALGETMMQHYPDLTVTFSFASSTTLAEQVLAGAPADVLATANEAAMTKAGSVVVDPEAFASNTLVIVTAPGNPEQISGLADFADADLTLAVCAVEVPCGAASATAFEAAGVTASIDTYAENVTATLNLVITGEADAALVYKTDAVSAQQDVSTVEFPESAEAVNTNWIAELADAPNPAAAEVFLALVASDDGQQVLTEAGFSRP